MQLKHLLFTAATVAALPATDASSSETFGVIAIASGTGVQNSGFSAAKSSLFAGLPSQNASCATPNENFATFYINNGSLFLYDASATPQEFYVDASGMGQGVIQYTTGAQPASGARGGWAIDSNNHLQYDNKDLIACPNSIDGAWSIWANAGYENPGYNENCVGIAARVEKTSNPNGCLYTQ
ncbi:hypothetical protein BO78DRAFT_392647 [Aspergillus sclerotiicarbonarius CBS 121057]|uniref:Cell wall protein PhiA n=1 Tax=Aspergillus sclerotiicarbonarius (strain CBS 121057 / IBT 28362) TaxID=1448318 RepID=A0A319EQT7_ASPSB|nr:hypothetical protein BO78DRAFT_392647 [Aspergillus sclerotiicarbonarius CBS 121057]